MPSFVETEICQICLVTAESDNVEELEPDDPTPLNLVPSHHRVAVMGGEDSEGFFSWDACGTCGQAKGGYRFYAHVVPFTNNDETGQP